ncbi:hypothetical protein [Candidatus Reidiella endopervernicosa]|uniref:Uncharacterized protein n=1 Tax=Candidatus Reidiella endopervernicosa TaxID=2738883 RepID=A0A6N0I0C4_9GAMM|nr:hypothetical protein [Candidatus Reidiella endopervernicosa]QKQ27896.1 hypothetical protein HUE57_17630 [Candidatus Reidiella endopervernicosa]
MAVSVDFEPVFNAVSDRINGQTLKYYRQISAAILDENTLSDLENDERWQALESISPDTPWNS